MGDSLGLAYQTTRDLSQFPSNPLEAEKKASEHRSLEHRFDHFTGELVDPIVNIGERLSNCYVSLTVNDSLAVIKLMWDGIEEDPSQWYVFSGGRYIAGGDYRGRNPDTSLSMLVFQDGAQEYIETGAQKSLEEFGRTVYIGHHFQDAIRSPAQVANIDILQPRDKNKYR